MTDDILMDAELDSTITSEQGDDNSAKKNQSNIQKLLAQRNEYKAKADKVEALEAKLAQMEELIAGKVLQDDKRVEELKKEKELDLYFAQNPDLGQFKDDIKATQDKYGMSLEEARTFVLAQKNPSMLDKQLQARATDNQPLINGHSNVQTQPLDPMELQGEAFDKWWKEQLKNGN